MVAQILIFKTQRWEVVTRAALWRKFQINSSFFSSTEGVFVFLFGRWTTLHSVLSMWWELQRLQEWNPRCIFGLLWHMFTCYRDPAMIVSMKHVECCKLFKRLDKQGTASAREMYVKEKWGGHYKNKFIQVWKWQVPLCSHSSTDMRLGFSFCSWRAHY